MHVECRKRPTTVSLHYCRDTQRTPGWLLSKADLGHGTSHAGGLMRLRRCCFPGLVAVRGCANAAVVARCGCQVGPADGARELLLAAGLQPGGQARRVENVPARQHLGRLKGTTRTVSMECTR